jgi:hypothetical protein
MKCQIQGSIGPFLDTVQQRQVPVTVVANITFATMGAAGSPTDLGQQVQAQMLKAIDAVISPKMTSGQLSFKDLGTGNTKSLIPEIIASSGLSQAGIAVDVKGMSFGIDGRAPYPPLDAPVAAARVPVVPQAVNLRVGGMNVRASADGGIDTAGIKNQLIDRAKSTIMWWLFGIGAVVVVLVCLGGYGYYAYKKGSAGSNAPSPAAKPDTKAHPGKK